MSPRRRGWIRFPSDRATSIRFESGPPGFEFPLQPIPLERGSFIESVAPLYPFVCASDLSKNRCALLVRCASGQASPRKLHPASSPRTLSGDKSMACIDRRRAAGGEGRTQMIGFAVASSASHRPFPAAAPNRAGHWSGIFHRAVGADPDGGRWWIQTAARLLRLPHHPAHRHAVCGGANIATTRLICPRAHPASARRGT